MPELSFREIAQGERTDGNPNEPKGLEIQSGEDSADLAVFAFIENNLEPRVFFADPQDGSFADGEELAFAENSRLNFLEEIGIRDAVDLDVVGLFDVIVRIEEPICPTSVVGEEEQPFACLVEAAHWRNVRKVSSFKALENGRPALLVGTRGYEPGGFVEHQIIQAFGGNRVAVHAYFGALQVQAKIWIGNFLAVYRNAILIDEINSLRARTEPEF